MKKSLVLIFFALMLAFASSIQETVSAPPLHQDAAVEPGYDVTAYSGETITGVAEAPASQFTQVEDVRCVSVDAYGYHSTFVMFSTSEDELTQVAGECFPDASMSQVLLIKTAGQVWLTQYNNEAATYNREMKIVLPKWYRFKRSYPA
jgi:hypothetical protein